MCAWLRGRVWDCDNRNWNDGMELMIKMISGI